MVVGFNVRPNAETRAIAEREGVEIRTYDVIYKLTEEIEQALVGMLTAVTTEETIGEAEVRNIFRRPASARSRAAWSRTGSSAAARTCA
jgi:translation initiation factor IF-2